MARSLDQCSSVSIILGFGNFVSCFWRNYYTKLPSFYLFTKDQHALDEAFKETFRQDDVMKLVEQPSESTLILRASIINLDVNAPDLRSSMRTSRYVHSAGEATLYLEIFDSVSGDLLARVIDHKQARDHSYLSLANSVNNAADARRGFEEWAKRLKAQFMKVKTLNER
jgi:hypothetical protein